MNRWISSLLSLMIVLGASSASAQETPPEFLYHWTSQAGLKKMAAAMTSPKVLPLRPLSGEDSVMWLYPELLKGRKVLFTWSHPVTGMAADVSEMYARSTPATGEPARLVVMKVNPEAKASVLISKEGALDPAKAAHAFGDGNSLVLHIVKLSDGTESFKEWIVLDPSAVTDFTANSAVFRPIIEDELRRLKDPAYRYPDEVLHAVTRPDGSRIRLFNEPAWRKSTVVQILKEAISQKTETIPAKLRRTLDAPTPASCAHGVREALNSVLQAHAH